MTHASVKRRYEDIYYRRTDAKRFKRRQYRLQRKRVRFDPRTSGSGKTTLLNIIGGLDRYTGGDLLIDGVSTKEYRDADWDFYRNNSIGFVFQSYNLIPHQTVLGNVEMALTLAGVSHKERRERAVTVLKKVGLEEHMHKKPNQMSGGQMQRVAIARALINNRIFFWQTNLPARWIPPPACRSWNC